MMRSYDGAKICDLVRLNLNRSSTVNHKSSVGLYRDNGLAAVNNANGPKLDRIKKRCYCITQGRKTFNHHRNKSYRNTISRHYFQPCNKEIFFFSKG